MNDCLFLPLRQGAGGSRALAGWECVWMPLGEGEAEGLPQGRGQRWRHVDVPAQQAATEDRTSIWYRTVFPRPDHGGRVLLRFGGAFLATNVWLNGRLLGSHYGYFAPFGFDITPHLRSENLLVVCCESPVEPDLARKRHIMGWLNDGDSRPYPGGGWMGLPEPYRWEVPVGLWAPVELEYADSVIVDWLRLQPAVEADVGRLEVETRLRNLDGREMRGELALSVGGEQAAPLRIRREYRLGGGFEQTVSVRLSLPGVRRWSPWRFGAPHLYDLEAVVGVDGRPSARLSERFGFRSLDIRAAPDAWHVRVNGRPMFLRGANYMPAFRLDHLYQERFREDLRLAKEANLDALRVHAHVLPDAFYREADAAGMLVLADLPLTRAYAYHAGPEEARFFERAVRTQVPEAVDLLRNRPSVIAWTAHDDPPWVATSSDLADIHAVRQNYTIDQEARALIEQLDPSRPALAASGELDQHAWAGWRGDGWEQLRELEPHMVTEYGAQALPGLDSPVWDEIGRRWPVADDDPAWLYAGFDLAGWTEHGAGLPARQESLERFVVDSQAYQAFLVGYATDQFRRRKFERCWGAFVYHLVDPFPGIGFGMLDFERRPRLAYQQLKAAMAATRLIVDPVGFRPLRPSGFGYLPGQPVTIRLAVVNDDHEVGGPARVRWWVGRERARPASGFERLRDAFRRKSYSGEASCELPSAFEPALHLTTLNLVFDAEGDYRLEAELASGGQTLATALLDFAVGFDLPAARERPLLPGFLADRIAERNSLEVREGGLRFTLLNRTRPATLSALGGLRLDGVLLAGARVLVETPSGRMPLPRRLELPVGTPVRFQVDLDRRPETAAGELEFDLTVPGVASGRVRVFSASSRTC